jgi:hypothetical protein
MVIIHVLFPMGFQQESWAFFQNVFNQEVD